MAFTLLNPTAMFGELRRARRSLRQSPATAAAAVVSLALALGTGTTVFAILDRTLLSPPPYPEPDTLIVAGEVPIDTPAAAPRAVTVATFVEWRDRASGALQLEPYDPTGVTLSGSGPAERLSATAVTPGLLQLLGATPRMGRLFGDTETGVVVISDMFRQRHLQADPGPIGKSIVLGGQPHTIVGVLPPSFEFALDASSLWLPLRLAELGDSGRVRVLGRRRPGVSIATAEALLTAAGGVTDNTRVTVRSLHDLLSGTTRTALPLLLIAALLAIGLTAVNLTGLLLLRTLDRSRELAIRAALGANGSHIARQVLVESHLVVCVGAAGGALLTLWLTPVAAVIASERLGATLNASSSWRAFAALAVAAITIAWITGLAPAIAATRTRHTVALGREVGRFSPGDLRARRALVAGELTLAFVLLASMLLVGRSLQRLTAIDAGFDPTGVLSAGVSLSRAQYPRDADVSSFYKRLDEAVAARLDAALIDELPLTGDRGRTPVGPTRESPALDVVTRIAGPRYFSVMRVPLVEGREFTPRDDLEAPPRVVISRRAADKVFPNGRAVGQTLSVHGLARPAEVIGVVGDVKHRALDESDLATVYFSALQREARSVHIVVRSDRDADDVLHVLREETRRLDAGLPVYSPGMLARVVDNSPGVPVRRVVTAMFAAFALLAVMIAAVGLFGVIAHDVTRRRVELAVRLALGADPARLQRGVLAQAFAIAAPGLAGGLLLSLVFSRNLRALVYDVPPTDPVTLVVTIAMLSIAALVAAVIPARRAARTSPFAALRGE